MECPAIRAFKAATSTCSSLFISLSGVLDQASLLKSFPLCSFVSRSLSPISICRLSGNSESIAVISDSLPQPLFILSSIQGRREPDSEIMSPRYLTLSTVLISLFCTFSIGHTSWHFDLPLICNTTLFSFERVSRCDSINELMN